MFWLDLAIAARHEAEQAFFEGEDAEVEDDIPRLRLQPMSVITSYSIHYTKLYEMTERPRSARASPQRATPNSKPK